MLNLEPQADIFEKLSHVFQNPCSSFAHLETQLKEGLSPEQLEQVKLVAITVLATLAFGRILSFLKGFIKYVSNLRVNLQLTIFNIVTWLPCGKYYLDKEVKKARELFDKRVREKRKNQQHNLPETPWKEETILKRIKEGREEADKFFKNGGRLSGGVYTANEQHWDFISECMRENIESNPLHMAEFTNVTQMEAEILKMTLNLFHGPEGSCGLTTSGGTESILIAMLAYREWGKARGITKPNIVTSVTAHAAFDKACFYFGLEHRKVPLTKDFKIDMIAMKRAVDSNTVTLVASAPEYPWGSYDNVPQVAALAKQLGINCHSDCCLGSYINPFTEAAGFKLPRTQGKRQKRYPNLDSSQSMILPAWGSHRIRSTASPQTTSCPRSTGGPLTQSRCPSPPTQSSPTPTPRTGPSSRTPSKTPLPSWLQTPRKITGEMPRCMALQRRYPIRVWWAISYCFTWRRCWIQSEPHV
ncbi:hypothetical protein FGO68_gene16508 [Halteria grandinella]|uniref:sphinganine-1-phosphate aldolase n=1 Tax=Halteria grandinella TaxID=5974 RepID=A0A8J8T3Y9_HALGN|nr:hypothetical protein FGO68_gene16508 [Halteria grandinella]